MKIERERERERERESERWIERDGESRAEDIIGFTQDSVDVQSASVDGQTM